MKRGISLLEGLVSLAILLVGLGGMAVAYQKHISQTVTSRNGAQASMIAQAILGEMIATDPEVWNFTDLANDFVYSYDGNRVDAGSSEAYYFPTIQAIDQPGFRNIRISIEWAGWRDEVEEGGFGSSTGFAYVLDTAMSPLYGVVTRSPAAGGP